MAASPRIYVVGAGAIGSATAARMAKHGLDITLIARGKRLEQIRQTGLIYGDGAENFTIECKVSAQPSTLR